MQGAVQQAQQVNETDVVDEEVFTEGPDAVMAKDEVEEDESGDQADLSGGPDEDEETESETLPNGIIKDILLIFLLQERL